MKSFKKVVGTALIVGLLLTSLGNTTSAATYYSYKNDGSDVTVPGLAGIEHWFSPSQTKTTTGSAYNNVTKIPDNSRIQSFLENPSNGVNLTTKVTYTQTGRKTMDYSAASQWKGKKVRLALSASLSQWSSVKTNGTWTPN
ncbi:hypothetical protein [Bacillus sp. PS06]|uniref:hypothetical protein n=1 Tax=Bacillus sp. PS06 TaxID=2764176 RepID=UPI0017852B31|nr:hypothetical protein [Bacillus sp. PS06]MBD8067356.1 hypothetical protein [Bacillus sp. PS06]